MASIKKILEDDSRPKVPLLDMAIWIMKGNKWDSRPTNQEIVNCFIDLYHLTEEEIATFFLIQNIEDTKITFCKSPATWDELNEFLPSPPDAAPDKEGTLSYLSLINVGPVDEMEMYFAPRLNIITGDNGLGKTFIMDCAWWALTGKWIDSAALPKERRKSHKSSIAYGISGRSQRNKQTIINYDEKKKVWPRTDSTPTIPGLIVYARVDGSYAVWDPIKQYDISPAPFSFSNEEVWYGKHEGKISCIDGLLSDWIKWQDAPQKYPFNVLEDVLEKMSPPDLGVLKAGVPIRDVVNSREVPTIIHPYGEIPITNVSAGIKRIITLAYLIVWSWHEHKENAKALGSEPNSRIVIMIDEIEAHLHPKWQRTIIPALLSVQNILQQSLEIEYIISTHSPLVLASTETVFNDTQDILFHMELADNAHNVLLKPIPFFRHGTINSWLMSSIFNMRQARSQEAEHAIEEAKKLQESGTGSIFEVEKAHRDLLNTLSQDDPFWPRWIYFAESRGLEV